MLLKERSSIIPSDSHRSGLQNALVFIKHVHIQHNTVSRQYHAKYSNASPLSPKRLILHSIKLSRCKGHMKTTPIHQAPRREPNFGAFAPNAATTSWNPNCQIYG